MADLASLFSQLDSLTGYCWSIGRSRHTERECRIWEKKNDRTKSTRIVVIEGSETFEEAIAKAIEKLKGKEAKQ